MATFRDNLENIAYEFLSWKQPYAPFSIHLRILRQSSKDCRHIPVSDANPQPSYQRAEVSYPGWNSITASWGWARKRRAGQKRWEIFMVIIIWQMLGPSPRSIRTLWQTRWLMISYTVFKSAADNVPIPLFSSSPLFGYRSSTVSGDMK